jgi:glutathione synthase/RimK-type ligase-like ATP-grasp enzyme
MPHPVIGFVTSAELRNLVADDLVLAAALERRGTKVVPVVWSETQPENIACDMAVIRSPWDYHLRPADFLGWLEEINRRAKVVNTLELVRWNADKRYLKEIEAAEFALPKTHLLERGLQVDLRSFMKGGGLSAVVIKPAISASAFETHRLDAAQATEFSPKLNSLLGDRAMLVQEFVPEIQTSGEWSLIFAGNEFTHAVNKLPRAGDFRVQEEHGGLHQRATPPETAIKMAQAILQKFAPQAVYCRADMVMRSSGPVLMELELIEPLLHFAQAPEAAEKMADVLVKNLP